MFDLKKFPHNAFTPLLTGMLLCTVCAVMMTAFCLGVSPNTGNARDTHPFGDLGE